MVNKPMQLIDEFLVCASGVLNRQLNPNHITHSHHKAPHVAPKLPLTYGAVYVFSLSNSSLVPAGPNRALKVGKVGAGAAPRFQYHHYGDSAPSTLAKAIKNNPILWPYIALPPNTKTIGDWMKQSLDRDSFFVLPCDDHDRVIALLEVFIKSRLGPIYEGSLSGKAKQ